MQDYAMDVLICGAGAAGLALAIDLARRGVRFRLIDKIPEPFHGSRGKGIQPRTQEIFEIVRDLNVREGVSFLLAEQNTNIALRYADYGYILENGRVMMDGEAQSLAQNEDVKEFYLGVSSGERKSFRDNKFYRRRKRWLA